MRHLDVYYWLLHEIEIITFAKGIFEAKVQHRLNIAPLLKAWCADEWKITLHEDPYPQTYVADKMRALMQEQWYKDLLARYPEMTVEGINLK